MKLSEQNAGVCIVSLREGRAAMVGVASIILVETFMGHALF